MSNYDNGFARAQRQYDNQQSPTDEDYERESRRAEAELEDADRYHDQLIDEQ